MKKNIKKIIAILLIFVININLLACNNEQIIDYNLNLQETEETVVQYKEFTFERPMDQGYQSKIVTRKDKDKLANEEVLTLLPKRTKQPVKAHGIYVPAYVVGNEEKFEPIFQNICNSNINTLIVDVKDELGRITIDIDTPIVKDLKTKEVQIDDVEAFLKRCHDNNIYVVARVIAFLDNFAPRQDKSMALLKTDGTYYRDNTGYYWLNPFSKKVQDYLKEVGTACAKKGFDEIQYDYFRFSADRGMRKVEFKELEEGTTKMDILTSIAQDHYIAYLKENVFFSLDVFGSIITSYRDQFSIGQDYNSLLRFCDYICPMVYPSHYANNTFGLEVPDLQPYEAVLKALQASITSIENQYDKNYHYGLVRPWLQGFTASYIPKFTTYEAEHYKDEIRAVEDSGYEEWIFWHSGGVYKWGAFLNEGAIDHTK